MHARSLVIVATCALLGGVACAPQTVEAGPSDPGVTSLLDGEDATGVTEKLHILPRIDLTAGQGVTDQSVAYHMPQRSDLTGFWSRADFGIPDGGWAEAATYAITKPDGGRLKIITSRTDVSVFIKRV